MTKKQLRPFFSFYGSKWRAAKHYPTPLFRLLVEPFAGSAGYSLRYPELNVHLYEIDPNIAKLWRYLISVPEDEIRALPLRWQAASDPDLPIGARLLIGFWLEKGSSVPHSSPSSWYKTGHWKTQFWGKEIRSRVASQVGAIRHWRIHQQGWPAAAEQGIATYFVDPPYSSAPGRLYTFNQVDYHALAKWCRAQQGQVIVCEQEGAKWLPFKSFRTLKANARSKISHEVVWTGGK